MKPGRKLLNLMKGCLHGNRPVTLNGIVDLGGCGVNVDGMLHIFRVTSLDVRATVSRIQPYTAVDRELHKR